MAVDDVEDVQERGGEEDEPESGDPEKEHIEKPENDTGGRKRNVSIRNDPEKEALKITIKSS